MIDQRLFKLKPKTLTFLLILNQSISMAQQYETQSFDLIKKVDEAEIRFYPPAMKIRSSRKNGFGALFGYISGRNSSDQKIAMTTPVYLGKNEDNEMMEFVLPKSFDENNSPTPESENVEVYKSKPGYYIAYYFGGYAFDWAVRRATKSLMEIIQENKIETVGDPIILVYDSPYKLINRKNEVLLKINFKTNIKK